MKTIREYLHGLIDAPTIGAITGLLGALFFFLVASFAVQAVTGWVNEKLLSFFGNLLPSGAITATNLLLALALTMAIVIGSGLAGYCLAMAQFPPSVPQHEAEGRNVGEMVRRWAHAANAIIALDRVVLRNSDGIPGLGDQDANYFFELSKGDSNRLIEACEEAREQRLIQPQYVSHARAGELGDRSRNVKAAEELLRAARRLAARHGLNPEEVAPVE